MLAHDGYEALECLEKQPAWLVIADVNMPGKGGIEMLREIRAGGNPVPVVLMTAYSTVETAVEALKLGAADYLQKPFPFQKLKTTIGMRPAVPEEPFRHITRPVRRLSPELYLPRA
ncbi:MAG: response regulator [candidate division Zixibacteria bacterium]|nr:response regulator [candidate division Zixibacteria bacterium]